MAAILFRFRMAVSLDSFNFLQKTTQLRAAILNVRFSNVRFSKMDLQNVPNSNVFGIRMFGIRAPTLQIQNMHCDITYLKTAYYELLSIIRIPKQLGIQGRDRSTALNMILQVGFMLTLRSWVLYLCTRQPCFPWIRWGQSKDYCLISQKNIDVYFISCVILRI